MSVELTMLAYSAALVQALAGVLAQGLAPMASPRDNLPPPKPFQARMVRAVNNHREVLTMFAPLVLAAAAAQASNHWMVLGAELFF